MLNVCVIGAGAAGLCAARHLLRHPDRFRATVFELSDVVGGTWVYVDETGRDRHGNPIHSSMYRDMKTNLPKEVMAFPDFLFPAGERSFLPHTEVRKYLEDYCDAFKIRPLVRFGCRVDLVEPVEGEDETYWRVVSTEQDSKTVVEEKYHAVFVCNGHYSDPSYGDVVDIAKFGGLKVHSHDYRAPEGFAGKTVAVLGVSASGMDIGLEVASTAERVYLCHNNPPLRSELPGNLVQVKGIDRCVSSDAFVLTDGSTIKADVLLFCTGYKFSFPFLSESCGVRVRGRQVHHLYRHLINCARPTMAFVGIPIQICPFPLFDLQVQWFCQVLLGNSVLPSPQDMKAAVIADMERRLESGAASRHYHKFGTAQWPYNRALAELAGVEGVPEKVERLYDSVHERRVRHLMDYKEDRIGKSDDGGAYVIVPSS